MGRAQTGQPDHRLLTYLPFAGALPFVFGALLTLLGIGQIALPGQLNLPVGTMVATYAVAIMSFMAGVHWGQYLAHGHASAAILVISNVVTVTGWLAMLVLAQATFLIVVAGLFVALLLVDWNLARTKALTPDYLRTRLIVTLIVVASLILTALF